MQHTDEELAIIDFLEKRKHKFLEQANKVRNPRSSETYRAAAAECSVISMDIKAFMHRR
jgi:hypothetical protein